MKVVALMSFYDETDEMLEEAILSLEGFCDGIVAVDGAYALYPDAAASSGGHRTIRKAAAAAGLELILFVPDVPWQGNETAKREFMFTVGEQLTSERDWYFIFDADFVVADHLGARAALEQVQEDVCSVTLVEPHGIVLHPLLFRAVRGITVGPAHHYWRAADGRWLWHPLHGVPKHDLCKQLIVEHRRSDRLKRRLQAALAYYATRDRAGIEQPESLRRKPRWYLRRERRNRAYRAP